MTGKQQGKHPRVSRRGRRGSTTWRAVVAWLLLFGLWMLLVGTLTPSEVVAGVAAAAIAVFALEVVIRRQGVRFRPDPRWVLRAWVIPWRTVREFGKLTLALWRGLVLRRRVVGRFVALDFRARGNDGRSVARRAVVTIAGSFAPNTYVVDFDRQRDRVIVHELLSPHSRRLEDVLP